MTREQRLEQLVREGIAALDPGAYGHDAIDPRDWVTAARDVLALPPDGNRIAALDDLITAARHTDGQLWRDEDEAAVNGE